MIPTSSVNPQQVLGRFNDLSDRITREGVTPTPTHHLARREINAPPLEGFDSAVILPSSRVCDGPEQPDAMRVVSMQNDRRRVLDEIYVELKSGKRPVLCHYVEEMVATSGGAHVLGAVMTRLDPRSGEVLHETTNGKATKEFRSLIEENGLWMLVTT